MGEHTCPQCESLVAEDSRACPSCGVDLQATLAAEPPGTARAGRLEFLPGQTFAERFTIIERIGMGGMGVVYKAIDNALDCAVALKLIRPEMAGSAHQVERFRREVRITRSITHPNVCRVHDLGEAGGVLYLSMEWIEGESLHALLRKTGTLNESRALQIAGKIARGLEAAHEKRIIHRDLKPGNVMVDGRGNVRVLDFGLAREGVDSNLTREGAQVGTPLFMAPEQKAGGPVDERADLYALGLILRHMLVGPIKAPGCEINPVIRPVLDRLLAEHPDERYSTASEARHAIEELLESPAVSVSSMTGPSGITRELRGARRGWLVLAAVVVVLALAALVYQLTHGGRPTMRPEARVFYERGLHYLEEESGKPKRVDDAIQMFHRAENLDPDSALILAQLSAAYSFRFRSRHTTASREEAERYIAKAHMLDPKLPELAYARGLVLFTEGKYDAAKGEFSKAVAGRPDLAIAWAYLGATYKNLGEYAAGIEALDRAIELENSFRMQLFRGAFHQHFGEQEQALSYYRRATELKPDSNVAWTNLGGTLLIAGRPEEAVEALTRSIEIVDDAEARTNLGTAYYFLGRYAEAVEHYRAATELQPDVAVNWGNLGDAFAALDRRDEAREVYGKAATLARERAELEPLNPDARQKLALYCAKAGDEVCAMENAKMAVELQPESSSGAITYAVAYCILGRDEPCLDWLERAVGLGAKKAEIEAAPELTRLAGSPRYARVVELSE